MGYYKGNRQIVLSFCLLSSCLTMCFCYVPASLLTTCCSTYGVYDHYIHPRARIGVSMLEWFIIIMTALLGDDHGFVFHDGYGFTIFIIGLILYLVSSQYLYFMPRFVMPHGVKIRSKWGYAFNGELEELKRMIPLANRVNEARKLEAIRLKQDILQIQKRHDDQRSTHQRVEERLKSMKKRVGLGRLGYNSLLREEVSGEERREFGKLKVLETELQTAVDKLHRIEFTFFDDDVGDNKIHIPGSSPVMFALANGHQDVAMWLEEEEQGAVSHLSFLENIDEIEERTKIARKY